MISVSIVSHGHGAMVDNLLGALLGFPEVDRIIVTRNIPEVSSFPIVDRIVVVDNESPKGFGENHNSAFSRCDSDYFCVINPDIEFQVNPFPILLDEIRANNATVVAPGILSPSGCVEDSARYFPSPFGLLRKLIFGDDGRYPCDSRLGSFAPEWCAGMFMLFRSQDFRLLNGFDESYYLYYEDVDICVRIWRRGMKVLVCPRVHVIHDARRDSWRNFRFLRWHFSSMLRFFWRHCWRLPRISG